ncbi:MAG: O-antigen ligase family protein [Planctomycetota bacterium]
MGQIEETPREVKAEFPGTELLNLLRLGLPFLPPVLVIIGLVLHPTQLTIRQSLQLLLSESGKDGFLLSLVPAVNIILADVFFLLGFVLWVVLRWLDGTLLDRLRRYPLPLVGMFAVGLLSILPWWKTVPSWASAPTMGYGEGIKQLVQFFLFFVCAFILLTDYLADPRWRRRLFVAFCLACALGILLGLREYVKLRPPDHAALEGGAAISVQQVDGSFGYTAEDGGVSETDTGSNRNVLGAWLTLVIPFFWAFFLWGENIGLRVKALLFALGGLVLILHGALWAAAISSVLILSRVRSRRYFVGVAAALFIFFGALFAYAPQKPGNILVDSLMMRRSEDAFRTLPVYSINPELNKSGEPAQLETAPYSPWEQKYIQWQPSILAFARHPITGVGLGNYQANINRYYSDRDYGPYGVPKAEKDLMERGGNSFVAVWAVETGFLGLLALLLVVCMFTRRGLQHLGSDQVEEGRFAYSLKIAALASLGATGFGIFFTDYLVRGVGYALVFVFAVLWAEPPDDMD